MFFTPASETFLKSTGIKDWGSDRTPPTPYIKCDISEFWQQFMIHGADDIEFRQITTDNGDFYVSSVHIVKYHDRAFMIDVKLLRQENQWVASPNCYRLGCIHDYNDVILNSRHGDCRKTCKTCGYSYEYNCGD